MNDARAVRVYKIELMRLMVLGTAALVPWIILVFRRKRMSE